MKSSGGDLPRPMPDVLVLCNPHDKVADGDSLSLSLRFVATEVLFIDGQLRSYTISECTIGMLPMHALQSSAIFEFEFVYL